MTDQDIIRLAEAMGWTFTPNAWTDPNGKVFDLCLRNDLPFHPFTDANDDYAVLEWMRNEKDLLDDSNIAMDVAWKALPEKGVYKIGDYARAALKVIDGQ